MHKQLQTIINKLGKTPEQEPEFYNFVKDEDLGLMGIYESVNFLLERAGKNIDDYSSEELSKFFSEARKKVLDFKYDNGKYKSTENTKELDNLSFKQRMQLATIVKDFSMTDDDDERKKLYDQQKEFIWNAVNLNKADLSDWEIALVEDIIITQASDSVKTALDIELGN